MIAKKISLELKKAPELSKGPIHNMDILNGREVLIELLTSVFIPFQKESEFIRLSGPFATLPFYHSPPLENLLRTKSKSITIDKKPSQIFQFTIYRIGCLILNQFYKQNLSLDPPYIFSIKNKNSLLEKHFQYSTFLKDLFFLPR